MLGWRRKLVVYRLNFWVESFQFPNGQSYLIPELSSINQFLLDDPVKTGRARFREQVLSQRRDRCLLSLFLLILCKISKIPSCFGFSCGRTMSPTKTTLRWRVSRSLAEIRWAATGRRKSALAWWPSSSPTTRPTLAARMWSSRVASILGSDSCVLWIFYSKETFWDCKICIFYLFNV